MTLQLLQAFDLSDQATIVWNPSAYPVAKVTLGGDRTVSAPVPLENSSTYLLFIIQDDVGSRTLTWDAVFKWPSGTPPTLSTGAGAIDIVCFVTDGTFLYGVPGGDFMSTPSGPYTADAVHFDGATWLHIDLLTATDNNFLSFAGWMKLADDQFNLNSIFSNDNSTFFAGVPDKSVVLEAAADGSHFTQINSTAGAATPDQWIFIIGSIDSSASSTGKIYIGDTDVSAGFSDNGIPFTNVINGHPFYFCNDNFGDFVTGDFADWRIMPGTSLLVAGDIPLATRRLFIDADGKPVNPAVATASLGTPCILWSGDHTTFPVNQGSGGAFTVTGTLTDASTSPSD